MSNLKGGNLQIWLGTSHSVRPAYQSSASFIHCCLYYVREEETQSSFFLHSSRNCISSTGPIPLPGKEKKDINESTLRKKRALYLYRFTIPTTDTIFVRRNFLFKSNKTEEHSMELYVRLRYPDELTTLPGTVLHDSNEKNWAIKNTVVKSKHCTVEKIGTYRTQGWKVHKL